MIIISEEELFDLLSAVNNEGAKHKRLISFQQEQNTATAKTNNNFILIYDSGPEKDSDNSWPI